MTLSEYLIQNPAAAAEIDAIKAKARDEGRAELKAEYDKRIAKCAGILRSEVYTKSAVIRAKALDCIEDKISTDVLDGAVGAFDMQAERSTLETAQAEQADMGETPPASPQGSEDQQVQALADGIAANWKDK